MPLIWTNKFWTRESVSKDLETIYIFGDNLEGWGMAGQACIRGLENAVGIPTKRSPGMYTKEFFYDEDFDFVKKVIDKRIKSIDWSKNVVCSKEIGRGLAKLHETSPKIYKYLIEELELRV